MRKITFIILSLVLCGAVFAQQRQAFEANKLEATPAVENLKINTENLPAGAKTDTDTLWNFDLATATLTNYTFGGDPWGSWTGHNEYGWELFAEKFEIPGTATLNGFIYMPFTLHGDNSVTFIVWDEDAEGYPGAELGSQVVNYSEMENQMANDLALINPIEVSGAFFIGYMINYSTPVDTFAMVQTQHQPTNLSTAHIVHNGEWYEIDELTGSPLYTNLAIGARINMTLEDPYGTLTPNSWNAGNVNLGDIATSSAFTLKNIGAGTLTVSNATSLSSPWSTDFNAGAVALEQDETYTFVFNFSPTMAESYTQAFTIETNGGNFTVNLSGTGIDLGSCLRLNYPLPGTETLYTSQDGYVAGNNEYDDMAKAARFEYSAEGEIVDLLIHLGAVDGVNGTVEFAVWDKDGNEPGAIMGTKVITMAELSAAFTEVGDPFIVEFDNPIPVHGDFFAGFFVSTGDAFAVTSNTSGDAPNATWSWEMWEDSQWYDFGAWGLNVHLAIFPEVCPVVSVENIEVSNINVYPNPASEMITITNAENANITVLNILGEIVYTVENAVSNQTIDISKLAAGTYFVRVNTEVFKVNVVK